MGRGHKFVPQFRSTKKECFADNVGSWHGRGSMSWFVTPTVVSAYFLDGLLDATFGKLGLDGMALRTMTAMDKVQGFFGDKNTMVTIIYMLTSHFYG